jgi:hypothetical protein
MSAMPDKRPVIVTARKPRQRKQPKVKTQSDAVPRRIVSARKPKVRQTAAENLSPEEVRRRGDAAVELFRELVRRATGRRPKAIGSD